MSEYYTYVYIYIHIICHIHFQMICQKLCQNDVWVGSLVVRYFFQHHRRTVSSKTICWFLSIYNSCIYSNTLLCMYVLCMYVLCMYILCMYRYSHRAIYNYTAYTYGNWTKIISLISLHQEWCILAWWGCLRQRADPGPFWYASAVVNRKDQQACHAEGPCQGVGPLGRCTADLGVPEWHWYSPDRSPRSIHLHVHFRFWFILLVLNAGNEGMIHNNNY